MKSFYVMQIHSSCMAAACLLTLITVASSSVDAQGNGAVTSKCVVTSDDRPDKNEAIDFFRKLQVAVVNDDRSTVASMIEYPMLWASHGKRQAVLNRNELLNQYNDILDRDTRCVITKYNPCDIWGNYRGFTIGRGVIWFDGFGTDTDASTFRIMTVNGTSPLSCSQQLQGR